MVSENRKKPSKQIIGLPITKKKILTKHKKKTKPLAEKTLIA